MNNKQPVIRKKIISCLIKIEQIKKGIIEDFDNIAEKSLRDNEPSVMFSVLPYYY